MTTDYFASPLAKKLGIKAGNRLFVHQQPKYYFLLFDVLPEDLILIEDEVEKDLDFVHLFGTDFEELKIAFKAAIGRIKKNGIIWVSYPKAASSIETNIKRDDIRSFCLSTGLVDVKVCSIDADWSAIKFVIRVKDR